MIRNLVPFLFLPISFSAISQPVRGVDGLRTNVMLSTSSGYSNYDISVVDSIPTSSAPSLVSFRVYSDTTIARFKPICYFNEYSYLYIPPYSDSDKKKWIEEVINNYKSSPAQVLAILRYGGSDSIRLRTDVCRLSYVIQEALDLKNNWNPIEYIDRSDCGWGQGIISLKSNQEVKIVFSRYVGDFKTKLRLKLLTSKGVIYSNEFEGSIYKNQFNKLKFLLKSKHKNYYSFLDGDAF